MWVGRMHAERARAKVGFHGPVAAIRIVRPLDMQCIFMDLPDDTVGIYEESCAYVSTRLSPIEQEDVLLHELGHHLMHGPDASRQVWRDVDPVMLRKTDQQADDFAYFFHLQADELHGLLWGETTVDELSERYNRGLAWMRKRIELGCASGELADFRGWVA
jgi:hypothetical protein